MSPRECGRQARWLCPRAVCPPVEVERLIGKLKAHMAVAMRFDKRAFVLEGTVSLTR